MRLLWCLVACLQEAQALAAQQRHLSLEVEAVKLAQQEEQRLRLAAEQGLEESQQQVQVLTNELMDAQVGVEGVLLRLGAVNLF